MQLTTKVVCQLLGRDRKSQADDIATGECGYVPVADGNIRFWELEDVVAERFFMDLRADGYPVKLAGRIATRLRLGMASYPDAARIGLVRNENGNYFAADADKLDLSSGWHSGANVREALIVDICNLRRRVKRAIADHRATVDA